MLVDPRPFTYEYRKPRIYNPTFQSRNLYESLYHRYPQSSNDYFPQPISVRYDQPLSARNSQQPRDAAGLRNGSEPKERRGNSFEIQPRQPPAGENPQKAEEYKLPSIGKSSTRPQYNYASLQEAPVQRRRGFQRFRIYQRQQKPFDIINCFPKEGESNRLRNFPKLTLEDRLLERGNYHTFQTQKF